MSKIDRSKFADKALAIVIGKKKPDANSEDTSDETKKDDTKDEPGKLGKMLVSAIRHQDYEAVEEAIYQITKDCPRDE